MSSVAPTRDVFQLLSALVAKIEQREARMQAVFDQRLQGLQDEVGRLQQRVNGIVDGAQARITEEAREALRPVAAEYGHAVSAVSGQLKGAGRMVWSWFAVAGATLLVAALAGWAVLGYYQRELTQARHELERYENAVPVVRAFYNSDAVLCEERLCVNVDSKSPARGERGRYRPVLPRSAQEAAAR